MKPATFLSKHIQVIGFSLITIAASGCGGSKAKVEAAPPTTGGTNTALTGSNCTKKTCPPADLFVAANFAASGLLMGFSGEAVRWEFFGIDRNTQGDDGLSSDRKVVVLLNSVPKGSDIFPAKSAGELSNEARVNWIPDKPQRGSMEFIARDYDRCMVNETKDKCNSYIYLDKYDKRFGENKWQVLEKGALEDAAAHMAAGGSGAENVVNVSNPNCGNPTTDAALNQQMIKLGVSILQGGGLASILPSLAGGLISGGGKTTGVNPTEC